MSESRYYKKGGQQSGGQKAEDQTREAKWIEGQK